MRWPTFALALLATTVVAQETTTSESTGTRDSTTTDGPTVVSVTTPVALPSGTYEQVSTTRTLSDGEIEVLTSTTTGHSNSTMTTSGNGTVITTTSNALTLLVGGAGTTTIGNSSMNATATTSGTATASPVVNTQPCNNYPEFCARKYSNITMVAAHNSPFVRKNNVAANQVLDVTQQLNDGVRMREYTGNLLEPWNIPADLWIYKCNSKLTTRTAPCTSATRPVNCLTSAPSRIT